MSGLVALVLVGCVVEPEPPSRPGAYEDVRRVVALLDDVAGEYPRAVDRGRVTDPVRMRVIATMVHDAQLFGSRFPDAEHAMLRSLEAVVAARDAPARVVELARQIRRELTIGHQLVLAPASPPDRARAEQLWGMLCAGCHGTAGFGDGAQGLALDLGPKNFHDPTFMSELAPSRAFSQISDGVRGTAMPQWGLFTTSERWGLAFLVFTFRHGANAIARGREVVGRLDPSPSLSVLADHTDRELTAHLIRRGLEPTDADDALAFLRTRAAFAPPTGRFADVRSSLAELARRYPDRETGKLVASIRRELTPTLDAIRATSPTTAARIEHRLHRIEAAIETDTLDEIVEREIVALAALLDRAEVERVDLGGTIRLAFELGLLASIALGLVWSRRSRPYALVTMASASLLGAMLAANGSIGLIWLGLAGALITALATATRYSKTSLAMILAALVGLPIGRLARSSAELFGVSGVAVAFAGALALASVVVAMRRLGCYAFVRWPRACAAVTTSILVAVAASTAGRGAWALTKPTLALARVEALGVYPSTAAIVTLVIAVVGAVVGRCIAHRRDRKRAS